MQLSILFGIRWQNGCVQIGVTIATLISEMLFNWSEKLLLKMRGYECVRTMNSQIIINKFPIQNI